MKLKFIALVLFTVFPWIAFSGVPESADKISPILIGTNIPDAVVRDINGKTFKLKDVVAGKPAVIIFYRGGWCPYCNLELGSLKKIEDKILKKGVQIVALSADRPEELKGSLEKYKMKYSLFSDSAMEASKAFGIAFKVDDETVEKYKGYKIDLEKSSGEKHHLLPVPSVFAVSKEGIIVFSYVNPNYKVRLSPEVLLAVVNDLVKKP